METSHLSFSHKWEVLQRLGRLESQRYLDQDLTLKKQKDALKLTKSHQIQKKSHQIQKKIKKASEEPAKAMDIDQPNSKKETARTKKYVTEGMVDYVTLLRSRQSGQSLKEKMLIKNQ